MMPSQVRWSDCPFAGRKALRDDLDAVCASHQNGVLPFFASCTDLYRCGLAGPIRALSRPAWTESFCKGRPATALAALMVSTSAAPQTLLVIVVSPVGSYSSVGYFTRLSLIMRTSMSRQRPLSRVHI
jgi:hypothetical protein